MTGEAEWAIYTIAFLCLLRSDEVLKIRREHVVYELEPQPRIVLTLPFRKTHQNGGMYAKLCLLLFFLLKLSRH